MRTLINFGTRTQGDSPNSLLKLIVLLLVNLFLSTSRDPPIVLFLILGKTSLFYLGEFLFLLKKENQSVK